MNIKVTTAWKGDRRTKMWIVHLEDGSTRGFPEHLYTKEEAIESARTALEKETSA